MPGVHRSSRNSNATGKITARLPESLRAVTIKVPLPLISPRGLPHVLEVLPSSTVFSMATQSASIQKVRPSFELNQVTLQLRCSDTWAIREEGRQHRGSHRDNQRLPLCSAFTCIRPRTPKPHYRVGGFIRGRGRHRGAHNDSRCASESHSSVL